MWSLLLPVLLGQLSQPALTDYDEAVAAAVAARKDLVIHFRGSDQLDPVLRQPAIALELQRFLVLTVSADCRYGDRRLLDYQAFVEMSGRPGLAVVSLHDARLPTHKAVISAHPLTPSRYAWAPAYGVEEVKTILKLPAKATLTQRSMIYAVSVHPERPQSVRGIPHPSMLDHCQQHCGRQAAMSHQHHADVIAASSRFQQEAGTNGFAKEVVAESWGNVVGGENVLEASFSCVDAWRHSSGHWSGVSGQFRYYGYDIAKSGNGTWYATGIFSD